MGSLPRSDASIERITKLKDRLRKVGKKERTERELDRAGRQVVAARSPFREVRDCRKHW
jgi:hypothetical protein